MADQVANPKSIASVSVDRLFGNRSYVIPTEGADAAALSKLLILYGDNGSGKTTILRMLYSLISPARKAGLKTYLARTPFASFAVAFADGSKVAAVRPPGELMGAFELSLTYPDGQTVVMPMRVNAEDQAVPGEYSADEERVYNKFLDRMRGLGIALFYLSDDRRLQTIHLGEQASDEEEEVVYRSVPPGVHVTRERLREHYLSERILLESHEPRGLTLQPAIHAFETWSRKHALRASTRGEGNANTIYMDVVRRITSASQPQAEPVDAARIASLKQRLAAIAKQSASFAELELISPPPVQELAGALTSVDEQSQHIVASVLEPYLHSIEARMSALQELRDVLSTFISNLNELYSGKLVRFSLRRGLAVTTSDGKPIPYDFLSSGEKQLLVLLCNTIIARDQTSIFVIDEPELSLNVKWQRRLVRTLLDNVAGSAVQFILATHSVELLAPYSDHVVKLETQEWPSLNAARSMS